MQRLERYHEVADQLLQSGHAYKCYCSKERLDKLRAEQTEKKEKPRYDTHCRPQDGTQPTAQSGPFVIRFRTPETGSVTVNDSVHGTVVFQNKELDDLVLIRTDGVPTYNFGVVVDDADMKITHVMRGDDHLANTPRQIHILKALGLEPPMYTHMAMILGSDGKRLSKRHGAVSVQHYRDEGILPDALLNYLVRLGWSHGDQEIFSREQMIEYFDIHDINKAASIFNPEKLQWLNQHTIKTEAPARLVPALQKHFDQLGVSTATGPTLEAVFIAQRERAKTLKEMAEKSLYFYQDPITIDPEAKAKHLTADIKPALRALKNAFAALSTWQVADIHDAIIRVAEAQGMKLGKLAQPLRVTITGNTMSPPIDITCELIGQQRVIERLAE
jgi:glutamyl-tRNA synthetase